MYLLQATGWQCRVRTFFDAMNDLVMSDEAQNCEIWALGDDNLNLRKRNNPHCKLFFDFLRQTGLRNLTTAITRPIFQGGSSIDHIITFRLVCLTTI